MRLLLLHQNMSSKDKEKDKVKRKRAIRSEDRGGSGDNKKSKTDGEVGNVARLN